ncbi:MAG TPA: acyl-CoA dehydrogenase family protein [Candidatus Binataceae bacterium]|nr:acyl-CoA dehydrogenase family protein [Candidatus Binataceae bacterium]
MDLNFTAEEEAFRAKVRAWMTENVPKSGVAEARGSEGEKEWAKRARAWQRHLHEAGYVALSWPKEFGGQAMDPVRQTIVSEEMARAQAPQLLGGLGIAMLGPTLITWGSEEQKNRYLKKILTAEEIWCQGYSEPGSGSDLASLQTRAVIDGDNFVVNGQKVWTSAAQFADGMFCLVRTDPEAPKHRGISYILIDMHSPGLTVRPLVQMTGDRGFNEVFFDNVRVPRANLVGKLNEGWIVANSTLFHERNMLGSASGAEQRFLRLLALAKTIERGGRPLTADPVFRQRLADLESRVISMRYHSLRLLTDHIRGRNPGVEAMVNKLVGTELNHDIAIAALEAMGDCSMLARGEELVMDKGYWPYEWMFSLGMIIGGGTSHIQKNIIAERGLKMPKSR